MLTKADIIDICIDNEHFENEVIMIIKISTKEQINDMKLYDAHFSVFGFENINGDFLKKDEYQTPGWLDPDKGELDKDKNGFLMIHFKPDKDYMERIEKLMVDYVPISIKFKLSYFGNKESATIYTPTSSREMPSRIEYIMQCDIYKLKKDKWIEIIYKLGYFSILLKKINLLVLIKNIFTILKYSMGMGFIPLSLDLKLKLNND